MGNKGIKSMEFFKKLIAFMMIFLATSILSIYFSNFISERILADVLRESPELENVSFWMFIAPYFVYFISFFTVTIIAYFLIPTKTYVHFVAGGSLAGLTIGGSSIKIASLIPFVQKFNDLYKIDIATAITFCCLGVLIGTLVNYFIYIRLDKKTIISTPQNEKTKETSDAK